MMRCAFVVVLAALATASQAGAQPTFDIVHAFGRGPTTPEGAMVETADGRLYGTTRSGGAFDGGSIFMVQRGADGSLPITLVHSFGGGSDGRQPRTGLILVDGALYGTTYFGGAHDYGTLFKMTLDGTFTAIHSFDGTEGAYPGALMRARDGLLYGVTETNLLPTGVNSGGTIFRISTAGAFTVTHVFAHSATGTLDDGGTPRGPLVQAPDGTFYGVTESGGSWSDADFPLGTIFELTEDGVFTRLHSFSANGFHSPQPGLILAADGSLYGATASHNVGGLQGPGAIFRRAPDGTVTFIHPFTTDANRWNPLLHFTEADGTIIGTTHTSVFRVTTAGTLTTLRAFTFNEGNAVAALLRGGDGRLYGSSIGGSITERGTVFGMTFAGELTGLNPFIVDDQPMQPLGALVPGADGSVLGITCRGGWLNAGTVYRRSAAGVVTTIKSFFILDGLCPFSLIRGADGFLYGTTLLGGASLRGTVFKISEAGAFTLLRTFSGVDGSYPDRLIQTANGQLWGTTYLPAGGQTDRGGIFRMSTTGALGAVFTLPPGCRAQLGPQAPNGAIYGTMRQCASNSSGTLFRMSENGVITTLFLFATNGAIGFRPAPLMLASDGNLYGTVEAANEGPGAIFVSTLSGQTTQIHAFAPGEGQMPEWGLIEGQDGLLYGTSLDPGSIFDPLAPDVGTVFSATKSGALTVLHKFSYAVSGGRPFGPLMQTPDGAIFGTTLGGGPAGQGTLFRITNESTGRR